jgi:hypothetical protein
MTIASRKIGAAAARALIEGYSPATRQIVDVHLVLGQSNAAQTTPVEHDIDYRTDDGVSWGVTRSPQPDRKLSARLGNGEFTTPHFGQANGWCHFAQEWFDLTGRRSVWGNFAVAGQQLVPETDPDATYEFSVRTAAKSLVRDAVYGTDLFPRYQLIKHVFETVELNPRFVRGLRFVHWVQGEQDVNSGIVSNEISSADYQRELNLLFDYMKAEFGIDFFFIYELGRKGSDAAAVAANEPYYRQVRIAQQDVVAGRDDTYMVFDRCKEEGSPFDSLAVDGDFYHVAGWDYQADGVHYEAVSYRCMGRTAARNGAVAIGLSTAPPLAPAFSNIVASQVPGTINQPRVTFKFTGRSSGTIRCRFRKNYAGEGKDIEGGFPLETTVVPGQTSYTIDGAPNLQVGDVVTAMLHWVGDGEIWPAGNAVEISGAVTITSPPVTATAISPLVITAPKDTPAGTVIGQLAANVAGGSFSEGSPDNTLVSISAKGQVLATSALTSPGSSTLKAIHTGDAGAGSFEADVSVVVSDTAGQWNDEAPMVPTVTVSSIAAADAQIAAWLGSSHSTRLCLGINAETNGDWTPAADFSPANNQAGLTIRWLGAYSENSAGPVSSLRHTGDIRFAGSQGIYLELAAIRGRVLYAGSTDCGVRYCDCAGSNVCDSFEEFSTTVLSTGFVVVIEDCVSPVWFRSAARGGRTACMLFTGTVTGTPKIDGLIFDQSGHDEMKLQGLGSENYAMDNVWHVARRVNSADSHTDAKQFTGINHRNIRHRYMVHLTRQGYGNSANGANQSQFFGQDSGETCTHHTWEECLWGSNHGAVLTPGTGLVVQDCTVVPCKKPVNSGIGTTGFDGADGAVFARNFIAGKASGQSGKIGPGGYLVPMTGNGSDADFAEVLEHIMGIPDRLSTIGALKARPGGMLDPANPTATGAKVLQQRLFDPAKADNPRCWRWPMPAVVRVTCDPNGELASPAGASMTYDSDGQRI